MKHARFACIALALVLASCGLDEQSPVSAPDNNATLGKVDGFNLTDRWIVVFKDNVKNVDATVDELVKAHGGTVHFRYRHAIKGMALTIPEPALKGLAHNPNIAWIEPDGIMTADVTQNLMGYSGLWGLDRIDQEYLPLNIEYTYTNTGSGVRVYIVDTGILTTHTEFGGRAYSGWDFVNYDNDATDDNGHGTHVAGTVGGSTYGVAKNVSLYAVKVLGSSGSGTTSGVIAGIDWVKDNHVKPAVVNMSLGGGASTTLDAAVNNCINAGVTFVVAAGNNNKNAANYSPARVAAAITVGATTSTDARASYSNYGSILDLFAPGSGILSAWYNNTTATNTISGTSMATPHVTGAAALYLQNNPSASPASVSNALTGNATSGVLTSIGTGSPNLLLFTGTPTPPDGMGVDAITTTAVRSGNKWSATMNVTIKDASSNPVNGATVTVTLSDGATGTVSATTVGGVATITKTNLNAAKVSSVKMTVTGLSKSGYVWNYNLDNTSLFRVISRP